MTSEPKTPVENWTFDNGILWNRKTGGMATITSEFVLPELIAELVTKVNEQSAELKRRGDEVEYLANLLTDDKSVIEELHRLRGVEEALRCVSDNFECQLCEGSGWANYRDQVPCKPCAMLEEFLNPVTTNTV